MADVQVVIAGGGIGGLTAGIALARAGCPVRIIEKADQFRAAGYGIQLGPNAFHAFERLGLHEKVLEKCSLTDCGVLRDMITGEDFARLPMGAQMAERFGHPYGVILRSDLHDILVEACRDHGVELVTNCELHSQEDTGDMVRLHTSKGDIEAGALIAADGVNSRTRAVLVGPEQPERLGYVAFRAVRPMEEIPSHLATNDVVLWCGPSFHMIHYPLRGGEIFNLVIGFDYLYREEEERGMSYKDRLINRFEHADQAARDLLPFIDYSRHYEIAAINPISKWSEGRVTLLGDSAHSMVQAAAQGACQAIEDCIAIASAVEDAKGDFAKAFTDFNNRRRARATRIQYLSRFMWELIHVRGAYTDLRNETLRKMSDEETLEKVSWVYDKSEIGLY